MLRQICGLLMGRLPEARRQTADGVTTAESGTSAGALTPLISGVRASIDKWQPK